MSQVQASFDTTIRIGRERDQTTEVLIERWQKLSDERAREELVRRFMPIARKLARRFQGAWEIFDDLAQVAGIGLVKAIDRFDIERGVTFQSYAVPTILGELKRYLRDSGWAIHVPRSLQERALKVEQAQRQLATQSGRTPTFNELAEYLEISIEDVLEAAEATSAHHAISFETPREDGSDDGQSTTLGETLSTTDEGFDLVDLSVSIGRAAAALTERERQVLALRFVADETQAEIAEEIGLSQMQVSRIIRQALGRMETLMREEPGNA
jgi:RNA polymerase sigma-B factor